MDPKPRRRWFQFGFSIRDLLLVTVIVALAMGWWLERKRAERFAIQAQEAAKEAESSLALSNALTQQLQNKNPAASIQINVRGRGSTTSTGYGTPGPPASALHQPKLNTAPKPAEEAGSKEAMTSFLSEVKKGNISDLAGEFAASAAGAVVIGRRTV